MKIIKSLVIASLLLGAPALFAKQSKEERFANIKQKVLVKIDKNISILQELKSCISSVNNKENMKSCKAKYKSTMKKVREEAKENVKKRKAQRKAKKAQKDSKKEEKDN